MVFHVLEHHHEWQIGNDKLAYDSLRNVTSFELEQLHAVTVIHLLSCLSCPLCHYSENSTQSMVKRAWCTRTYFLCKSCRHKGALLLSNDQPLKALALLDLSVHYQCCLFFMPF